MKKLLLFTFLPLFFACTPRFMVLDTQSTQVKPQADYLLYETDTLQVRYSFWFERGLMSFTVYNKLNVPIYLDWKKSSYIENSKKYNYWADTEFTESAAIRYEGVLIAPNYQGAAIVGRSNKTKEERIVFIPPKSYIYRSSYYLLDNETVIMLNGLVYEERKVKSTITSSFGASTTMIKTGNKSFEKQNTPLAFRNFLTFSTTENFATEFYIDNEFWVSQITLIPEKELAGREETKYQFNMKSNYKKPSAFYKKP
jgi:hypothetical protein